MPEQQKSLIIIDFGGFSGQFDHFRSRITDDFVQNHCFRTENSGHVLPMIFAEMIAYFQTFF